MQQQAALASDLESIINGGHSRTTILNTLLQLHYSTLQRLQKVRRLETVVQKNCYKVEARAFFHGPAKKRKKGDQVQICSISPDDSDVGVTTQVVTERFITTRLDPLCNPIYSTKNMKWVATARHTKVPNITSEQYFQCRVMRANRQLQIPYMMVSVIVHGKQNIDCKSWYSILYKSINKTGKLQQIFLQNFFSERNTMIHTALGKQRWKI